MAVIIARRSPYHPMSASVLSMLMIEPTFHDDINPLSLIGLVLATFGAWVRWNCYRVMKSQFTFELSIRKDHKLITTGPYAVVRHPSYTGLIAWYTGVLCYFGSRGSWLRESHILDTRPGAIIVGAITLYLALIAIILVSRMWREDEELKQRFGTEWKVWARCVPYMLIPGVY
jgi:protein-S-isoprenylcysteine O-methyltransferase Ste14